MAKARVSVTGIQVTTTAGDATFTLVDRYHGRTVGGDAIEAGGRIDFASGSGSMSIEDQNGVVLRSGALSADETIDPVPRGVRLPLKAVVTSSTNLLATVYWSVKK